MGITRVKYLKIHKHGRYYRHSSLESINNITCPECGYCKPGNNFWVQESTNDGIQTGIHNVFTLKCFRCDCVFIIKV